MRFRWYLIIRDENNNNDPGILFVLAIRWTALIYIYVCDGNEMKASQYIYSHFLSVLNSSPPSASAAAKWSPRRQMRPTKLSDDPDIPIYGPTGDTRISVVKIRV